MPPLKGRQGWRSPKRPRERWNCPRGFLVAPSLCLLRPQLCPSPAPCFSIPEHKPSPLPLESSSCTSNGVMKPLILLTNIQFTGRPVMGIHFGGQYSCRWKFPQGRVAPAVGHWQKLFCLASEKPGELLIR